MDLLALQKVSYGMYILSSFDGDEINACLVNTVFQITDQPPVLAVSVNKQNLTHSFIEKSGKFSVSVVTEEADMKFLGPFGFKTGKDIKKFEKVSYKCGISNCPVILENTSACFETKLVNTFDMNTHTIFCGEVKHIEVFNNKTPMTYKFYHEVIKGKASKHAPTYIKPSV